MNWGVAFAYWTLLVAAFVLCTVVAVGVERFGAWVWVAFIVAIGLAVGLVLGKAAA